MASNLFQKQQLHRKAIIAFTININLPRLSFVYPQVSRSKLVPIHDKNRFGVMSYAKPLEVLVNFFIFCFFS